MEEKKINGNDFVRYFRMVYAHMQNNTFAGAVNKANKEYENLENWKRTLKSK